MLRVFQESLKECEEVKFQKIAGRGTLIYMDAIVGSDLELALEKKKELKTVEEGLLSLFGGNALLVDEENHLFSVDNKGFPMLGVSKSEDEKVMRGSEVGFCDTLSTNTALIRNLLRTRNLKVKNQTVGVRTKTAVSVMYMKGIVREELVCNVLNQFRNYSVDAVLDSGVVEQLTKKHWKSPFPEVSTTRRPDKATFSLLEGKIVLLCDHSPVALNLPTSLGGLLKKADDYYNSFFMASLGRLIRYLAAFLSFTLPGLYLVVTNFHTQVLPTPMILALQEARNGVPFPAEVEILLMELSFELLREAGIRLPNVLGNTIGIVGGLIIGQASVEAGIVSPIVVVLVALTALCSFAIPDEELAFSFRLLKFYVLVWSAGLGLFGFFVALLSILIHLSKLKSYGVPYLMPYVATEYARKENWKDGFVRFPYRFLRDRPMTAPRNKIRLRKEK